MYAPDTPIQVDHVSKKFCRDFRRSLWYGLKDVVSEVLGDDGKNRTQLRPREFQALHDVSMAVKSGECVGLLGPNGSGKSSLLKLINGLMKPDAGSIRIRGRVGALIELTAGFNPILTGRENIYINASVLGMTKREVDRRFDAIVDFAEIPDSIDSPVQSYSSGMKTRLGFAVAAHLDPDILLVDEVLAVGDVGFRWKCIKHMIDRKASGLSILLVTHNTSDLQRICDRVVVLSGGRKVFDGGLSEGIGAYQTEMKSVDSSQSTERPSRAWIESVELSDDQGQPRSDFYTRESLCATLTLGTKEPLEGARIAVIVTSPVLGALGGFSTPYTGFRFDVKPPATQVKLTMPALPLLVGEYRFNFALFGPEYTEIYDRLVDRVSFKIVGPATNPFNFGVSYTLLFDHHWDLLPDTPLTANSHPNLLKENGHPQLE